MLCSLDSHHLNAKCFHSTVSTEKKNLWHTHVRATTVKIIINISISGCHSWGVSLELPPPPYTAAQTRITGVRSSRTFTQASYSTSFLAGVWSASRQVLCVCVTGKTEEEGKRGDFMVYELLPKLITIKHRKPFDETQRHLMRQTLNAETEGNFLSLMKGICEPAPITRNREKTGSLVR